MARKAKIYSFIDHSSRTTKYVYVKAYSQKEVAEITKRPLSYFKGNLRALTSDEEHQYSHLNHGEIMAKDAHPSRKGNGGMSRIDIDHICSLGHVKAARLILNQCDLRDRELKTKYQQVLGLLDELRAELAEALDKTYTGR